MNRYANPAAFRAALESRLDVDVIAGVGGMFSDRARPDTKTEDQSGPPAPRLFGG
jgi:hypothetical protein